MPFPGSSSNCDDYDYTPSVTCSGDCTGGAFLRSKSGCSSCAGGQQLCAVLADRRQQALRGRSSPRCFALYRALAVLSRAFDSQEGRTANQRGGMRSPRPQGIERASRYPPPTMAGDRAAHQGGGMRSPLPRGENRLRLYPPSLGALRCRLASGLGQRARPAAAPASGRCPCPLRGAPWYRWRCPACMRAAGSDIGRVPLPAARCWLGQWPWPWRVAR